MRALRSDDRGATAIFLAMTLMLLLGVAAIAVDLAQGWNERRQDQTAADTAAVAGALSYDTNQTTIADQVMDTARMNLDTTYSDSEWDALWTACAGPPPAGFLPISHSTLGTLQCIGINPSYLWVRVPDQIVETSFGKAIGVDSLTTGAEATVTLLGGNGGGALPFAIRGNAGSGEVCLDTGPKPEEPCDGNESGSFGNIAPPLFGNGQLNTTPSCSHQSSSNNYVPESIAMGIDHILWSFSQANWTATGWSPNDNTGNNTVRNDPNTQLDECIDTGGAVAQPADGIPINTVYVDTGNSTKDDITEGLMTGTAFSDGKAARLTRSTNTRNVKGYQLDNTALWEYLMPYDPAGGPGKHTVSACDGPAIRGLPDIDAKNTAMRDCLEAYPTSGGPQIFTNDIIETPRIGVAPRLWHNNLGSGITFRPIQSFDLVFIHGVWFKKGGGLVSFYPDEGTAPFTAGSLPIEQVTAYLLLDSMVSDEVHTSLGGFSNDTWQPEIYE
jgi:hypothetical protein